MIQSNSGDQSVSMFAGKPVVFGYGGAPDIPAGDDIDHSSEGAPANPYVPDLRSPGPGHTDSQHTTDPEISITDIKPGIVLGVVGSGNAAGGTASPSVMSDKVVEYGNIYNIFS